MTPEKAKEKAGAAVALEASSFAHEAACQDVACLLQVGSPAESEAGRRMLPVGAVVVLEARDSALFSSQT